MQLDSLQPEESLVIQQRCGLMVKVIKHWERLQENSSKAFGEGSHEAQASSLSGLLLGKSGIVFPKLTNVTIPMNSNFSGNTRQNTDTK